MIQARESSESASELVLDKILGEILTSRASPGMRLPAERELSTKYETSRVTIREALQKLVEWGVISIRRGSGAIVRDQTQWSFQVLPAYLVYGSDRLSRAEVRNHIETALQLRRFLFQGLLSQCSAHLPSHLDFSKAQKAVQAAWKVREDSSAFAEADLVVFRSILQELNHFSALWLLNDLARVYIKIFSAYPTVPTVLENYVQVHTRLFKELEARNFQQAADEYDGYLKKMDGAILSNFK